MSPTEAPPARRGAVTPRTAGTALVVVSAAIGALAASVIVEPIWAVPAAVLLAFASAGVAAGLLLLRRQSWSDGDWPSTRGIGDRRLRRLMLFYGGFLLLVSVAAAVGLLVPSGGEAAETARGWWLVGGSGLVGVAFVALGLAPIRPAVESSERPDDEPSTVSAAWVRLGPARSPIGVQELMMLLFGYQLIQVPILFLALLPVLLDFGSAGVAAAVAVLVAAVAVTTVVVRRQRRSPWVARGGAALRLGKREVQAADIGSASIAAAPWQPDATERSLTITFGAAGRFRATVGLRRQGRLVLTKAETALLVKLVSHSSIDLPRDENDPKGRFSKALYPNHLMKEDALALVEHPPGDGEPLPIAASPGQP